jgi:hypothetical protein
MGKYVSGRLLLAWIPTHMLHKTSLLVDKENKAIFYSYNVNPKLKK